MDPDAALAEWRAAVQRLSEVFANYENSPYDPLTVAAQEVLDRSESLDKWMASGGFLPADWNKNRGTGNDKSPDGGSQADSSA